MKSKNLFYALSLAVAAMTITACSSENALKTAPDPSEASGTWQVTVNAGPAQTRAISVGGNSGNALYTNWDTGDVVEVYKGESKVGELTATASTGNSAYAVLAGTLTGSFAVNDELTLYYHSRSFDYTGQVGTLAGVSTNKSYMTATTTVTAINAATSEISSALSGNLVMSNAAFTAQQAYLDLTFTDVLGNPYNVKTLAVYDANNGLRKDNTWHTSEDAPLTITPASPTSHYFLALRDEYDGAENNTYYFKATLTDDSEVTFTKSAKLQNGHYYKSTFEYKVKPTISVTDGNQYEHIANTGNNHVFIGTSDTNPEGTSVTATISGTSRGYYIDLGNPTTVTLNNLDAILKGYEFLSGMNSSAAYSYTITGTNTIRTDYNYAIYADYNNATIKLQGNGTLTVTSSNADYCGIIASNYRESNNSHGTTTEVDVSTQLAATGCTVKRSARTDNSDGTYTWTYTVRSVAFSVSSTKQVIFSPGNLQYKAGETYPWRFAEHQYDFVGLWNTSNWVDLFGWGTWTGASPSPLTDTQNNSDYSWNNADFTKESMLVDASQRNYDWRTLTGGKTGEWMYVLGYKWDGNSCVDDADNTVRYQKSGHGTVEGVIGMIIVPDYFIDPMKNGGSGAFVGGVGTNSSSNVYTAGANWDAMEAAGCVFLPFAYYRNGSNISGAWSIYWSSTPYASNMAYNIIFDSSSIAAQNYGNNYYGNSVRLVRDL